MEVFLVSQTAIGLNGMVSWATESSLHLEMDPVFLTIFQEIRLVEMGMIFDLIDGRVHSTLFQQQGEMPLVEVRHSDCPDVAPIFPIGTNESF